VNKEAPAEVAGAAIVSTELSLEGRPGDEACTSQIAEAVGEPGVDVESQGRAAQGAEGPQVNRHRMPEDFVEEAPAEGHGRAPERLLIRVVGRPPELVPVGERVSGAGNVRGAGLGIGFGLEVEAAGPADCRGEETMQLVGEAELGAPTPGDWCESELAHESREGGAEVQLAASRADGLRGDPGEDESGVGAVGKADRGWGVHVEGEAAVDALELVTRRPTVRERGLDEDPGHETERVGRPGILSFDGAGSRSQPVGSRSPRRRPGALGPASRLSEARPFLQLCAH
jgi:hypothetical protein